MKIAGVDPKTLPTIKTLVLPRGDNDMVVFYARGVRNFDEFNALCPEPRPATAQTPEGIKLLTDDPGYVASMAEWAKRQTAYIVIKSLEPSNIEWDTVKLDKPGTWANWRDDLKANDFSNVECNHVFTLCWEANQLDESAMKRARDVFQAGQQRKVSAT